jgi:hypothetical protein
MIYLNYYSPSFIGRSCYYQLADIQEHKQYATVTQNVWLKPPDTVTVNILSAPIIKKMSNYVAIKTDKFQDFCIGIALTLIILSTTRTIQAFYFLQFPPPKLCMHFSSPP